MTHGPVIVGQAEEKLEGPLLPWKPTHTSLLGAEEITGAGRKPPGSSLRSVTVTIWMKTGMRPHPPNPDFSHYRLGLTSRPSQGYLEGHAKAGSVSEPRGPAGAWRGGRSYSRTPIPVAAGTPGEFCVCSVNCSPNRGHSPGGCEPKSTVNDSEGEPLPPRPPLPGRWACSHPVANGAEGGASGHQCIPGKNSDQRGKWR